MRFLFKSSMILLLFTVLFVSSMIAQNRKSALSFLKTALESYQQHDYSKAKIYAVKAISKDSTFADPYVLLGDIYLDEKDNNAAIGTYTKGVELNRNKFVHLLLNIAELELQAEKFGSAVEHASEYLKLDNISEASKDKAELIIKTSGFRQQTFVEPVEIHKHKLQYHSKGTDEYVNGISLDGKKILFTQKKKVGADTQGNQIFIEQILEAELDGDSLKNLYLFDLSEGMQNRVGAASLSVDGRYLFFTDCHQTQNSGGCDLYCMSLTSKNKKVFYLGRNVNSREWESQPCFSADGKTLFFASKREGGYGGSDIWCSILNDEGYFSRPINLGAAINTAEDEMAPFIHADNNSLYFSSKGHPGIGGFDLFLSRKDENGNWTKPENMGYPLNTTADEINLIIAPDGINAYISAKDEDFDIYRFEIQDQKPGQVSYVYGKVLDAESLSPLFTRIELFDLKTGDFYAKAQSFAADGHFIIPLPIHQSFAFHVHKQGYLFYSENFNVSELIHSADTLMIKLHPIRVNVKTLLNNVFFETNSYVLLPESKTELDYIIRFLKDNPDLMIEIGGHTDNVGSVEYNMQLSKNRAKAVFDYLVEHGIDQEWLSYKGYGETQAVSLNETQEGRAQNRRTEFKIVGIKTAN